MKTKIIQRFLLGVFLITHVANLATQISGYTFATPATYEQILAIHKAANLEYPATSKTQNKLILNYKCLTKNTKFIKTTIVFLRLAGR